MSNLDLTSSSSNLRNKVARHKIMSVLLFIFIGIVMSGCSSTNKETVLEELADITPVFDLEELYGKNIDEIREILGEDNLFLPGETTIEPTEKMLDFGRDTWNNTFDKGDYFLSVEYNVASREVIEFFTGVNVGTIDNIKIKEIEQILNIKNSNNYIIEPVNALIPGGNGKRDPSLFTGIVAIPKK